MEDRVEIRAMELVTGYYKDQGYIVDNVSRIRGDHSGYDLVATKDADRVTVEVKGCTRPYGIPYPYCTEFDKDTRRLVADVLCVAYFVPGEESRLAIIPRDAIPPEFLSVKWGYRISGRFKNARTIEKYLVKLQEK